MTRALKIISAPYGVEAVRRAALRQRQRALCPSLVSHLSATPVARKHPQTAPPRVLLPPNAASHRKYALRW